MLLLVFLDVCTVRRRWAPVRAP